MTGITVGFDGSHGAQRALEWAMTEASLRRAQVTVLAVHPVAISNWTGKLAVGRAEMENLGSRFGGVTDRKV
jgi:nucleotide-binding universal stress UspA family protein